MSLWDSISAGAKKAGDKAAVKAKIGKLKADIVLLKREMTNRQRAFGIAMYDHVSPLSQSQDFYAANDPLTNLLRPPLITAQKEIQALAAKKVKLKEKLAQAEANRAAAFPKAAETVGQKFVNFGKASVLHGGETKIKGELAIVDRSIKGHKQNFGIELYALLVDAEDNKGFLPTDRQVRNIYDTCRGDIQRIEAKVKTKEEEIIGLGGTTTSFGGGNSSYVVENADSTAATFEPPSEPALMPSGGGFSDIPSGNSFGGGCSDNPTSSSSSSQQAAFSDPDDLLL
jgi:hypothetical protein